MKILFHIISLLFIVVTANAQSDLTTVKNRTIGWSNIKNKDIISKEIVFRHTIYNTDFDTNAKCVSVRLHKLTKKGRLIDNSEKFIVYDLGSQKVKWFKDYDYRLSRVIQYGNFFFHIDEFRSICLNSESGEKLWSAKNVIHYVDPFQKIALGYKSDAFGTTNTLQGIDLTDGSVLWERKLSKRYGWNEVISLDTSTVIIVSEGLNLVKLNDGTGWNYNTITGELHTAEAIAATAVMAVTAVLSHTYMVAPLPDVISDVVSNVWTDSTGIYFAAKEKISCVDYNGHLKWSTSLPDEITSKSYISKIDDILYLVNTGYAYKNQKRIQYGNPFIAGYDMFAGRKLFFTNITGPASQINSYKYSGNSLYLLFDDRISEFNLANGALIKDKVFDISSGKLKDFVGMHIFSKNDSIYQSLVLTDATQHYLLMDNNDIWVLNKDLDIVNNINNKNYYLCYMEDNGNKYFAYGDKTIVINSNNEIIATLDISEKTFKIGSNLYSVINKSLIEIAIKDIW